MKIQDFPWVATDNNTVYSLNELGINHFWASVQTQKRGASEEEIGSITQLIAAAPDLAEAILPFSGLLQSHNDQGPDNQPIFGINDTTITLGDLRKAVAALKKAGVEL